MKVRYGKPVDISAFKGGGLDAKLLKAQVKEYATLAKHLRNNAKDRVEVKSCYTCGSRRRKHKAEVFQIPYLECSVCGLLYAKWRFTENYLEQYYARKYSNKDKTYANEKTYRYRMQNIALPKVDFVREFLTKKHKNWLDVGCGIGDVPAAAKLRGYKSVGVELSETAVAFGKKVFKTDLRQGMLSDILKQEGEASYDIVSFFGVIEHIPDPVKQVRMATKMLRKKGILVIEVPNANSISTYSDFIYPDQVTRQMYPIFHIMVYTASCLSTFLEKEGYQVKGAWYLGLDIYNVLLHAGIKNPNLWGSPLAEFFFRHYNEFQKIVDQEKMSDQMIFVASKK